MKFPSAKIVGACVVADGVCGWQQRGSSGEEHGMAFRVCLNMLARPWRTLKTLMPVLLKRMTRTRVHSQRRKGKERVAENPGTRAGGLGEGEETLPDSL